MEVTMKKASLAVLVSLSALTTAAFAQDEGGIRTTHDPQVAAEIEQHAQEAQSAPQEAMPMQHPMHHAPRHHKHEKQQ
jgi:hypothetical protein